MSTGAVTASDLRSEPEDSEEEVGYTGCGFCVEGSGQEEDDEANGNHEEEVACFQRSDSSACEDGVHQEEDHEVDEVHEELLGETAELPEDVLSLRVEAAKGASRGTLSTDSWPEEAKGGNRLADRLLRAIRDEASVGDLGMSPDLGRPVVPAVADELHAISKEICAFLPRKQLAMTAVLTTLNEALYQMRAWCCESLGELVFRMLERIADLPQRLPSLPANVEPAMVICRLLEGFILCCVAHREPFRTAALLESLLRRRRVPPLTAIRLEAAMVQLRGEDVGSSVPPLTALNARTGGDCLCERAKALLPSDEAAARLRRAQQAVQELVSAVFPNHRPDFFGGAVNGFQTTASDLDCVVQLAPEVVEEMLTVHDEDDISRDRAPLTQRQQQKVAAAQAARKLERRMLEGIENAEGQGLVPKEVIADARVPILKCESRDGIAVDISFNNVLPIHNSRLLLLYADLDRRVGELGRLVKCWAKRRGVNNVQEGTLSSYSYVLLVVHYLQHVGMLPNLQDKSHNEPKLVDGIHDVAFLDPGLLPGDHPLLKAWIEAAHDDATLEGLFFGFFHYYAYEFPLYADVISIRFPGGRLPKVEYFTRIASFEVENMDNPNSEGVAVLAEDRAACNDKVGEEANADVAVLPTAAAGPVYQLSRKEHTTQHLLGGRLTVCIDDPLECGRTLGTSFQGAERLVYELRRACELLRNGCTEKALEAVFTEQSPKSLWKLVESREFPHVVGNSRAWNDAKVRKTMKLPAGRVGSVIGVHGAAIKDMRDMPGIQKIDLVFDDPLDKKCGAALHIAGISEQAVQECAAQVDFLLSQKTSAKGGKGGKSVTSSAGPTGRGRSKGQGKQQSAAAYDRDYERDYTYDVRSSSKKQEKWQNAAAYDIDYERDYTYDVRGSSKKQEKWQNAAVYDQDYDRDYVKYQPRGYYPSAASKTARSRPPALAEAQQLWHAAPAEANGKDRFSKGVARGGKGKNIATKNSNYDIGERAVKGGDSNAGSWQSPVGSHHRSSIKGRGRKAW